MLQLREQLKEAYTTRRDMGADAAAGESAAVGERPVSGSGAALREKAQRRLQAELKRITDSLESTHQELQDSRRLLERVKTEASSSRQEALRLRQEKQQIQEELDVNRETLSALKTKVGISIRCREKVSYNRVTISHLILERLSSRSAMIPLCRYNF
ncbi:hypothetical protein cypCar_00026354 [Cyprinus carpio]|nr:hypothetical protein cypCar_00026354 [Cyprinus carpio]